MAVYVRVKPRAQRQTETCGFYGHKHSQGLFNFYSERVAILAQDIIINTVDV